MPNIKLFIDTARFLAFYIENHKVHFPDVKLTDFKIATHKVVRNHPGGIRQSAVAKELGKELGIPSKFDLNWIAKYFLDVLVKQNLLTTNPSKLCGTV